jgi:hypothetical protein
MLLNGKMLVKLWNGKDVEGSVPWPNLRYCIGISLEGMWNAKKHLSQGNQSLDWDLNLVPQGLEAGELNHDVRLEYFKI